MALLALQNISMAFGGPPLLDNACLQLERDERVCLLGRNGEGKSTLLRIIGGELAPLGGEISRQKELKIGLLQQQVAGGVPGTVAEVVAQGLGPAGEEWERQQTVKQAVAQVGLDPEDRFDELSGGQKRRALLARALVGEPDLLVLDEPTNDLDLETLDLLEDLLVEFDGTLLLVSHDRAFLNEVVTSTLVFEGAGRIAEYVGGYDDWLRQRPPPPAPAPKETASQRAPAPVQTRPRKLTFKEQRELAALPARITQLEQELEALHRQMSAPEYYRRVPAGLKADHERLERIPPELEQAYDRWAELEEHKG